MGKLAGKQKVTWNINLSTRRIFTLKICVHFPNTFPSTVKPALSNHLKFDKKAPLKWTLITCWSLVLALGLILHSVIFFKIVICWFYDLWILTVDWEKRYFCLWEWGPYSAPNIGKYEPWTTLMPDEIFTDDNIKVWCFGIKLSRAWMQYFMCKQSFLKIKNGTNKSVGCCSLVWCFKV